MVGKTAREYPKTEELREAAKAAFRWQGTCYGAFTFEQTGVAHYLDKADYSTAMKDILDKYNKSGSWDSYLSMDNWQQSIKDYTSVPVYFNRDIIRVLKN